MHSPWVRWAFLLGIVLQVAACSSLPPPAERTPSLHLTDTTETRLGRAVAADDPGDGRSGLAVLAAPLDAFVARVALVRSAERTLDVQYYIWHGDISGLVLLEELRLAAQRGVRVRLLLDDNGIGGMDPDLALMAAVPGVQVRVFNPYPNRQFKLLGYLTEFDRLNRRMHNKSLIADAQVSVVGGRNIGDAYFGVDPRLDFADLDVVAAGTIARSVSRGFDDYWNSPQAWPIGELAAAPAADAAAAWGERIRALGEHPLVAAYAQALKEAPLARELSGGRLSLEWVPMRLVIDPPSKAGGSVPDSQLLAAHLTEALGPARSVLDLVSPYFVPGAAGTEALAQQVRQGVRVRVLTNSLAATDVPAVHAGYARHRQALLAAGVELFELKHRPKTVQTRRGWGLGSSSASLHGKTFAIDRERSFVGSFNIDPRSYRLNTELGLVVESPRLARSLSEAFDQGMGGDAYALRLDAQGEIEWVDRAGAVEVVLRAEPGASLWRRLQVRVLSWLPLDSLL